ncbi:cytochrome c oxidase, subunit VIa [Kalaharituber pfeilii]|nr:cytochrome c oxidase, subunit VIa [Kalaharituber pfeilii]
MLPHVARTAFLRAQFRAAALRRPMSTAAKNPADNAFNKERAAIKAHAAQTAELWRKLSLYVAIPALIVASINAYQLWNGHWEHVAHEPPLEEKTEYPYQNIRVKNFCWGDGDKTLFWNDKVNYHKKE